MRSALVFARAYPLRTAATLACLLLAGVAEGFSVASAVPALALAANSAAGPGAADVGGVGGYVTALARGLGMEPTIGVLLALIAGGIVLRALLVLLANRQVGYAVAHMATDLRLGLIRALMRSRWPYFIHQPLGAIVNAVASEARRAADAYLHAATLLALLIQGAAYVVVGCLVSWRATLVTLLAAAVMVAVLHRLVRRSRRAGAQQTTAARSLLRQLTDTLQSIKPLRAMGQEALVAPMLEATTNRLERAIRREVVSREALQALQDPLMTAFLAIGLYAAQGALALPLATVILLVLICGRVIALLGQAQKEAQHLAAGESAFWSLRAAIADAERAREQVSDGDLPQLRRAIEVRQVRFAYDDGPVLDGVSLVIPAGEMVAVVGPSGAGKTTIADLVIGLLEPQAGAVMVDDVPLDTCDAARWRAMIGYVPQDTFLLHDSVAVNVTLGDQDLSPADVEAALREAGAWDFVTGLAAGVDTIVGERGLRLSGGQRQRISLARALVRRPQLLILDEATAALDPTTEADVCQTLQRLRGRMTILAVCHHGPLIEMADRVYQIDAGRVTVVR
ncbi:ABC transporter ATP-binding protein [bacterium]|nr:ABC transporter ATP-binding protein [bacterium]